MLTIYLESSHFFPFASFFKDKILSHLVVMLRSSLSLSLLLGSSNHFRDQHFSDLFGLCSCLLSLHRYSSNLSEVEWCDAWSLWDIIEIESVYYRGCFCVHHQSKSVVWLLCRFFVSLFLNCVLVKLDENMLLQGSQLRLLVSFHFHGFENCKDLNNGLSQVQVWKVILISQ